MRMNVSRTALTMLVVVGLAAAVAAQAPPQGGRGGGRGRGRGFSIPPLMMHTDAYEDGAIVPAKYASGNNGPSVLPGFTITNAPMGTVAYAVIYHDIEVGLNGPGDVLHFMAWNIPASANGWPEGMLPAGSVMGKNLRGQNAYMGPAAPAGPRYHHYVWELYALNANLDLDPAMATRDDLLKALQGKVIAKAAYVGRYRSGEAPAPAAN
ncbi:MAG TPA: YbhB/YbcL family Raf kinase inhibitor-like protein [Vicinamibacterales bacterium]|nr:YbhB/YbcL family Raf kinase inhibitor-like protein [Vicinamibacterales bacterium]